MNLLKKLNPGDTIGIFAPGSPTRLELVEKGIKQLESEGFKVSIPLDPSKNYGRGDGSFSSASVEERLSALNALLDDDKVKVILSARGAYGTAEILPKLDFKKIALSKKAIIGYSDVTALVSIVPKLCNIPAIHGPTLTKEFAEASESKDALDSIKSLLSILRGESIAPLLGKFLKNGAAEGPLLVGNLSVLCALLGTPFEPDFSNAVLVIEETGEAPYRIHRMLMQLKLAGKLESLAALAFARFSKCESKNIPSLETTITQFLAEQLKSLDYPVLAGLELGHNGINLALPCGVNARVEENQLRVVGKVVE